MDISKKEFVKPVLAFLGIAAVLTLVLAGCAMGPSQTQGVSGFAKGVITAKGSIFVNGVEYDTANAAITVDDTSSHPDSDLKVGMVVKVKGSIDETTGKGVAQEVLYAANLEGLIDAGSIDLVANTFTVFGQTITVDATTVYEGVVDLTGLVPGDRVEVSGTADLVTHAIKATRVEKKSSTSEDFEIKGILSGLGAGTFTLTPEHAAAGLTVTFTGSLVAGIVDGSFVEVKFASFSSPLTTTADKVKLINDLEASDNERVEASGIVTGFTPGSPATFTIDAINVSADSSLAAGVANGVEVEVKGTMTGGVLVAESVKVERESNVELEGDMGPSGVDTANKTLTLDGVVLAVDSLTIFRDDNESSGTPIAQFKLADILAGDHLEVSAYPDSSVSPAKTIATRVERKAPSTKSFVKAPVSAKATGTLTILGVTVDTSAATFRDANETTVDQATFLGLVTPDVTVVKVKGTWNGTVFAATQASIED